MENLDQSTIFKFNIDDTARQNLKGIAQWAKLNALFGFISVGLSFVTVIVSSLRFLDAYITGELVGKQLITWIISLVLNIILLKAANNIYSALLTNDQRVFNIGINQLARYFKIIGIIFIVAITFAIVAFIFLMIVTNKVSN
jgi:hypothetical protein